MTFDSSEGYESPRLSRHGGHRTWWAGWVRFFRRRGQHPRHSAGITPTATDEAASGSE